MNWDFKDWLALASLLAVFYGGINWIYKNVKKLSKFLDDIADNEKQIQENKKQITFISAKLDSVITLLHDPMFVCNDEGLCIVVSDSLCELFGATTKEKLLGGGWVNFIIPEDRNTAWEDWIKNIKDGSKDMVGSYRIRHGVTGNIIPVVYHAVLPRIEGTRELIISVGKVKKIT